MIRGWLAGFLQRNKPLSFFIAVVFMSGVLCFGVASFVSLALFFMPGPAQSDVRIILPKGASLPAISRALAEGEMIRHPAIFRIGVRLFGQARDLQAGEYEVPAGASHYQLMSLLVSGKTYLHAVTVPEGLTSQQIVELLQENPILAGEIKSVPEEGSLLPETYKVRRGTKRHDFLSLMQNAQSKLMAQLWDMRVVNDAIKTPQEALILASIVQKETGLHQEYGLVASVFLNRLAQNMRLQSDPTIIYGLVGGKGRLNRAIRLSEIKQKTAYNTYQIAGLPPTPITNPGRDAIAAVLRPPESPYFYFVADGKGGHVFAKNLKEHEENVRHWRLISKRQKQ